jgi:CheY-like chemotaxis protein
MNTQEKYKYNNALLIDDNEVDNFINERIVESNHFAKNIYFNTNGRSAIEFINNLIVSGGAKNGTYPDVMFVDLNMPLMDGFKFLEIFKRIDDEKLKKCKIVILTSSISEADKAKAATIEGDVTFVNKPLTPEVLNAL